MQDAPDQQCLFPPSGGFDMHDPRVAEAIALMNAGYELLQAVGACSPLDNNFLRELIICRFVGLDWHSVRGAHDASEADGKVELKATDINAAASLSWSTSRSLTPKVMERFREMSSFYFAAFDGLDMVALYRLDAETLGPILDRLQAAMDASQLTEKKQWPNNHHVRYADVRPVAQVLYRKPGYKEPRFKTPSTQLSLGT